MNLTKLALILFMAGIISTSCDDRWTPKSITSPTYDIDSDGNAVLQHDLSGWYPCVGVQSPGGPPFEIQMDVVSQLQAAGRMEWIRLNVDSEGSSVQYHERAREMGLKIFNIISNKELETLGWENAFDTLYNMYPGDVWEMGGEIQSEFINPGATLTPEEYMIKFKKLVAHVEENYPGAVIASAPPEGNTSRNGPATLQKYIDLGLLDLDVVIAINVYSDGSLAEYSAILDKYAHRLTGKEIWVTETGVSTFDRQIDWVERFYPRITAGIWPDMVCWYIMYGGDGAIDEGYGLIAGVDVPPLRKSPLLKALLGEK